MMRPPAWMIVALVAPGLFLPAAAAPAQPSDAGDAFVLVATEALEQSNYRRTVILAVPTDGARHLGIILNRPTQRSLSDLFPEHEPSRKITDTVYFGGPMSQQAVFALTQRKSSPGPGSIRVLNDVFLALTAAGVDRVIEEGPQSARFYIGAVIWRPDELRDELGSNYWHVMNAHPDLLFRKDTRGLWEELTRLAHALTADASHASAGVAPRGPSCRG